MQNEQKGYVERVMKEQQDQSLPKSSENVSRLIASSRRSDRTMKCPFRVSPHQSEVSHVGLSRFDIPC